MTIDLPALKKLKELLGGDPEDIIELINEFRSIAPKLVANIVCGVKDGDIDATRIAAHTLKSNATDMGAPQLSILCSQLESQAKARDLSNAEILASHIDTESTSTLNAISKINPYSL